jgi:hypothetical protein
VPALPPNSNRQGLGPVGRSLVGSGGGTFEYDEQAGKWGWKSSPKRAPSQPFIPGGEIDAAPERTIAGIQSPEWAARQVVEGATGLDAPILEAVGKPTARSPVHLLETAAMVPTWAKAWGDVYGQLRPPPTQATYRVSPAGTVSASW